MSDASLSIRSSLTGRVKEFEANSSRLETKTLGLINFDKSNDFSVPLKVGDGKIIYLKPEQVDAIRMRTNGAGSRADIDAIMGESKPQGNISVTVDGKVYQLSSQDVHEQLQGNGFLT